MVVETLSSGAQNIIEPSPPNYPTRVDSERQTAVSKSGNPRTMTKPAGRQQRLRIHLMIGILMAGVAVAGYTILGPGARVSAAGTANYQLINVSSNDDYPDQQSMQVSTTGNSTITNDMAALHVEMEEITRQMNALKGQNYSEGTPQYAGVSQTVSVPTGFSGDSFTNVMAARYSGQIQATLDLMMAMTHEMMAKMENIQGQANGAGSSTSRGGHH